MPTVVLTDDADLAVELSRLAPVFGLGLIPELVSAPWEDERDCPRWTLEAPSAAAFLRWVQAGGRSIVGWVVPSPLASLAEDVGIPAVDDPRVFLAGVRLQGLGAPIVAGVRGVPRALRALLEREGWPFERDAELEARDDGLLGIAGHGVGEAYAVARAGGALLRAMAGAPPGRATVGAVDPVRVRDVLFGPRRTLSDPASKAALTPYGVRVPVEELCTSPSRAASEAARIGFPVKVSIASPDLRIWDHPDLAVLGAANATAVREAFRVLTSLVTERDPSARLLGVQVTAETATTHALRVVVQPSVGAWSTARIEVPGSHSATLLALPTTTDRLRRAFDRLGTAIDRAAAAEIAEGLTRVAAFAADQRDAVESIRIDPLVALIGGSYEAREVAISINGAFELG